MIGDGYKTVLHCPNVDPWDGAWEPDANPVHCTDADADPYAIYEAGVGRGSPGGGCVSSPD